MVYLNQSAQSALQSVPVSNETKPTDKVFAGVTPDQVSVTFRRLCRKMGVSDFRFHDLRHTAASWMRMQGADIHTQLLGHKDLRMAARYHHDRVWRPVRESNPCRRCEREGNNCNSMELRGMDSTLPHLKDSRECLLDRVSQLHLSCNSLTREEPHPAEAFPAAIRQLLQDTQHLATNMQRRATRRCAERAGPQTPRDCPATIQKS